MLIHYNKTFSYKKPAVGKGLVNKVINSLPVELHLPRYQFCGPGTKLKKHLDRCDNGINLFDAACKNHDIAYSKTNDLNSRHQADKILENKAWERVLAKIAVLQKNRLRIWLLTQ